MIQKVEERKQGAGDKEDKKPMRRPFLDHCDMKQRLQSRRTPGPGETARDVYTKDARAFISHRPSLIG